MPKTHKTINHSKNQIAVLIGFEVQKCIPSNAIYRVYDANSLCRKIQISIVKGFDICIFGYRAFLHNKRHYSILPPDFFKP